MRHIRVHVDAQIRIREKLCGQTANRSPVDRQAELIDHIRSKQICVAESIGLSQVVVTLSTCIQQIVIEVIRNVLSESCGEIAPEDRLLVAELIVEPADELSLVDPVEYAERDPAAGIGCLWKLLGQLYGRRAERCRINPIIGEG